MMDSGVPIMRRGDKVVNQYCGAILPIGAVPIHQGGAKGADLQNQGQRLVNAKFAGIIAGRNSGAIMSPMAQVAGKSRREALEPR
jgi:hypothetical protein